MAPEFICDVEHCRSHEYVERTMERQEKFAAELAKSHSELVGVVKDILTLTQRIEKVEANQDDIKKFVYKIAGVITAAGVLIPLLVSALMKM